MKKTVKRVLKLIQGRLKENCDEEVAVKYEKYFKNVVKFFGYRSKDLTNLFKPLFASEIKPLDLKIQIKIAFELFTSEYAEEKKIGIMILDKNTKNICKEGKNFTVKFLSDIEELIEEYVYDWGTADTLAGRVISEMIKINPKIVKWSVKAWKDSKFNWVQRVCCVSFVKVARFGKFNDDIIDIAKVCVLNQYRFVQLGNGWMLRELSLADEDRVIDFIKENYDSFSREGLRYAIEKMDKDLRKEMLDYGKMRDDNVEKKSGKKRKRMKINAGSRKRKKKKRKLKK